MAITETDLTEEQKGCIAAGVAWWKQGKRDGFGARPTFKVQGGAGVGKSETARFLIGEIGLDPNGPEVWTGGPTGKSAMVMRRKGLRNSTTIHSGIYSPADDVGEAIDLARTLVAELRGELLGKRGAEREALLARIASEEAALKGLRRQQTDELKWTINPMSALAMSQLGLCDEASMVGGQLKRDLEEVCLNHDVGMIYLGDNFQLQPIDEDGDSVFFAASGALLPCDYNLTQIHRQAEGSAIIRYSRDLREGRPAMNFFGAERGEDGGMVARVPAGRLSMEQLAAAEQIIVGFNETRHRVNTALRGHLGRQTAYPEAGDRLICLRNNKELRLVNGMMATATSAYDDFQGRNGSFRVDVELEDGREMPGLRMLVPYFQYPGDKGALFDLPGWSRKRHAHFDYGYAISCHKAQGSQYRGGVVFEEGFGRDPLMKRRWRYTAATRYELNLIIEA
jgi:exodeoxyribonuclease-5